MNRIDTNGKNTFNVGDEVYIIESNRNVRKVTIIKISRDFCTVRFADTDGAIAVRDCMVPARWQRNHCQRN